MTSNANQVKIKFGNIAPLPKYDSLSIGDSSPMSPFSGISVASPMNESQLESSPVSCLHSSIVREETAEDRFAALNKVQPRTKEEEYKEQKRQREEEYKERQRLREEEYKLQKLKREEEYRDLVRRREEEYKERQNLREEEHKKKRVEIEEANDRRAEVLKEREVQYQQKLSKRHEEEKQRQLERQAYEKRKAEEKAIQERILAERALEYERTQKLKEQWDRNRELERQRREDELKKRNELHTQRELEKKVRDEERDKQKFMSEEERRANEERELRRTEFLTERNRLTNLHAEEKRKRLGGSKSSNIVFMNSNNLNGSPRTTANHAAPSFPRSLSIKNSSHQLGASSPSSPNSLRISQPIRSFNGTSVEASHSTNGMKELQFSQVHTQNGHIKNQQMQSKLCGKSTSRIPSTISESMIFSSALGGYDPRATKQFSLGATSLDEDELKNRYSALKRESTI